MMWISKSRSGFSHRHLPALWAQEQAKKKIKCHEMAADRKSWAVSDDTNMYVV